MLMLLTIACIGALVYAGRNEGTLTNVCTTVNVLISGLVAFNFFEPIADELDSVFQGTFLAGTEDCLALVGLFSLCLGLLRLAMNALAPSEPEQNPIVYRAGGIAANVVAGYLTGGFLAVAIVTLPLPRDFLGYTGKLEAGDTAVKRFLPGDRVWLAMMHRVGSTSMNWDDGKTFDKNGNFLPRYYRHRRYNEESGKSTPDDGSFLPRDTGKGP